MADRINKKKERKAGGAKQELYMAIPLCLIVAVVPLIIFVKKVIVSDPGNLYWDGRSSRYDIFTYYKMVFLLIFTAIGMLLYLSMRSNDPFEKSKRPYYIPVGAYCLLTLLSAGFSEYRHVAFLGFLERYEGAVVLLAYSAILFLSMNVFSSEKTVRILFGCLLASCAVISVIGVFQYFGIDLFQNRLFQSMIIPASLKSEAGEFNLRIGERTVYSTLYNPNYVGSYMAMALPVILVMMVRAEKVIHKATLAILLVLAAITLVGSDSRAGLLGTVAAFIVLIVLYRKKILQRKWIALAVVVAVVGGLAVFNFMTDNSVISRISRMLTLEIKDDAGEAMSELHRKLDGLVDVLMEGEKTELVTEKGTLCISLDSNTLVTTDENGTTLESEYRDGTLYMRDDRFSNIRLEITPEEGYVLVYYNDYALMDILLTEAGMWSTSNRWMIYRNGRQIESFGFEGMETLGSNRGYIWSRTIPLLKDTIFIGKGPDTFALYFPQYDFLGKLKFYMTGSLFVDKAHSMYLQTALTTGVLSLAAILVLFVMYAVLSLKVLWDEDFTEFLPAAGLACFAAFCGYAIAGLFNDSTITVAPVFWVLLGMGTGINVMLGKKRTGEVAGK